MMRWFRLHKKYSFEWKHDRHSHILPDLDDGVKTLSEAVELVKRMTALGVERFTFTPHIAFPGMLNNKNNIGGSLLILKKYLESEGLRVPMEAAAEYRMGEFMLDLLDRDDILASSSGEVLVEHSFYAPTCYTDDILCRLRDKGYQPVLAHPERYPFYLDDVVKHCEEMKHKGCKIQVNILSFTGYYGKEVLHAVQKLYDADIVDYYASDIHGLKQMELLEDFMKGEFFYS